MKRLENDKWLDDALTKAIGSEKSQPDFERWKQDHPEAVEKLTSRAGREKRTAGPHQIWRIIMKSPITKLAVAAVVIIACLIGLSLWRTSGSGIALADVLARIEKVKAYRYKLSVKITGEEAPGKPINYESHDTELISQEYGRKTIRGERDPNGGESSFGETYFLPQKKTTIMIMPKQKKYWRTEFEDVKDMFETLQEDLRTWMVKEVLEGKYESLGRTTVDGIEVEGFQRTERGEGDPVDWKIWVDVKTRLPVRWEEDNMHVKMRTRIVMHDFQWDVLVDAAEFEPPPIPGDYTGSMVKMPALTEEKAIKGLKLYADLSGHYREELTWKHEWSEEIEKMDTPAAKRLKEELKGLTKDDRANRLADTMMPMRWLSRFCIRLIHEGKHPAYYGKTVTPTDADKVLMRWKVSDNEYRVIFGDLHSETVTTEKLAELEKLISK